MSPTGGPADATRPAVPFVGRQLTFLVSNQSGQPARLVVAAAGILANPVGLALPPVVGPRTRQEVSFAVPNTNDWAIWVHTADGSGGELIGAGDVRRCVGRVPIEIIIGSRGDVGWSTGPGISCVTP